MRSSISHERGVAKKEIRGEGICRFPQEGGKEYSRRKEKRENEIPRVSVEITVQERYSETWSWGPDYPQREGIREGESLPKDRKSIACWRNSFRVEKQTRQNGKKGLAKPDQQPGEKTEATASPGSRQYR